ncbi:MAG: sulfatase, partial [Deltaproteobacteria bacterium]|nr:sulfatase [Deltaproteobacteria bacterium]MBW2531007.1 sulfatase [Deltaproteobacteria bacterium]
AAALSALAVLAALALAVRVVSGGFLTLGALQFSLGSGEHFLRAASGEYSGWSMVFVVVGLGLVAALVAALRGAATEAAWRRPWSWRAMLASALCAALVIVTYGRRGESPFSRGMFRSAPLLALVSSADGGTAVAERFLRERPLIKGLPRDQGLVRAGPPMAAERAWRSAASRRSHDGPNVILVMLESVSARHVGYAGRPRAVTPEIDRLAREGLRFRRVWTTATHSNYAQPAVLSSLLPYRRTALDLYHRLDYPRVLFHDLLHELGYDTAMISSQDETWQGMARFHETGTPTFRRHALDHDGPYIDTGAERIVPDELTTDLVLTWLTEPRDRPWGLYVNFQTTHFPYTIPEHADRPFQPSQPDRSRYTYVGYPATERPVVRNRFDNALSYVDEQIGRIRRYLEDTGEFADTLWIITADHGELFGQHGMVTHGRTLFDAEARVPLVIHWPKGVEAAERHDPVSLLDVMPTMAELLGVPPHPSFQGRSLVDQGPRRGAPRAIFMTIQGWSHADGVVCWPWKLIADRTNGRILLYHLERDPEEVDNLVDDHPSVAARLGQVLDGQLRAQLDYYDSDAEMRRGRFAPRLASCPELPRVPTRRGRDADPE